LPRPTFTIRPARPEDAPSILDLWREERTSHASTEDRLQDIERLLAETPGSVQVATDEDNGLLLGALIAAWDGWRGNMYRLAVRREHRRQGVGLALVRAGEAHLHSLGGRRITALVGYDDDLAGGFWEAAGYPQDRDIGRRVRNLTS
jgi:ribosomal protein S18 acetylase RimI-like enzyme